MQKHNSEVCTTIRRLNYANFWVAPVLCNPSQITGVHSSHRQYCKTIYLQVIESNKLLSSVIEIALRHGCSPVNWLHIFRTPFLKNTSGRLVLYLHSWTLNAERKKTQWMRTSTDDISYDIDKSDTFPMIPNSKWEFYKYDDTEEMKFKLKNNIEIGKLVSKYSE